MEEENKNHKFYLAAVPMAARIKPVKSQRQKNVQNKMSNRVSSYWQFVIKTKCL
jgi:hypothetical protein